MAPAEPRCATRVVSGDKRASLAVQCYGGCVACSQGVALVRLCDYPRAQPDTRSPHCGEALSTHDGILNLSPAVERLLSPFNISARTIKQGIERVDAAEDVTSGEFGKHGMEK